MTSVDVLVDESGSLARSCVVIVAPNRPSPSETFIRAHVEQLPSEIVFVHGSPPRMGNRPVLSWPRRAVRKAWRVLAKIETDSATAAYEKVFRRYRPCAVLAEYGPTGVAALPACRTAGVPLLVHFHGFDASMREVLAENAETYPAMFRGAAAIIAVSRAMQDRLITLGAPAEKVYYNPYGVDCREFDGAAPATAAPIFVAVGRLTAKKAPRTTLTAFADVRRLFPAATLRMVGDGPLMTECRTLARDLGIEDSVTFLGVQPPAVVREEMRRARCFVQHSVEAASGDSEGTPVSIIEAGATGLPVVSTRHAGIPDIVIEGNTGFLVEEHDVATMARHMLHLARDPGLAGRLGRAARARIERHFSMERSIGELWRIIRSCGRRCEGPEGPRPRGSTEKFNR